MQDDTNPQPDNATPEVVSPIAPQDSLGFNTNVLGTRVWAYLIDLVPWIVGFIIAAQHFGQVNASNSNYNANLTGLPAVVFALVWLGYYILMEWLAGGSLGKLIVGIRVRNELGEKLTFTKSLVRNLLRLVDGFPYIIPNLVGFIIASTNDKKQRLGDKAAHTLVIKSDKTQPASVVALLTLLILTVAGVVVIVTVPASKANTTQTATTQTTRQLSSNQSGQNGTAEDISSQFVNDIATNNPTAAYQLTTVSYKTKANPAQNANQVLLANQLLMNAKPAPLSGQTANQCSYYFEAQNNQGQQTIVIVLQYDSGNWLVKGWEIFKGSGPKFVNC